MTFTNFILTLILSVIDLVIIEFYLSKSLSLKDEIKYKPYYGIEFFLFMIININLPKSHLINMIILICTLMISIYKFNYTKKDIIKFLLVFLSMFLLLEMFLSISIAWIFDTSTNTMEIHKFLSYKVLSQVIHRYIEYIIILFILNMGSSKKIRLHYFKIVSIIFSIYFSIAVVVNNDKLFYFRNVGRTFLFIIITYNIALIMFDRYQRKAEDIEKELLMTKQNIELEQLYIKEVGEKNKQMLDFRHDIKNRSLLITGLIQKQESDAAIKELEKVIGETMSLSMNTYVNNVYVDTIIDAKVQYMKQKGIVFSEAYGLINIGNIDPYDLALALALALDNAIEAVELIKNGPKEICLDIHSHLGFVIIKISNTIPLDTKIHFTRTSKVYHKESHGFGVKKIKCIAESYDGHALYEVIEGKVLLKIIMSTD